MPFQIALSPTSPTGERVPGATCGPASPDPSWPFTNGTFGVQGVAGGLRSRVASPRSRLGGRARSNSVQGWSKVVGLTPEPQATETDRSRRSGKV